MTAPRTQRPARIWHAGVALLLAAALFTQFVLSATGIGSTDPDADMGTRIIRLFSFFTILSNILFCAISVTLTIRPDRRGGIVWRVLRLDSVLCMTVTGLIFITVLRGLESLQGLRMVTDVVFHYAAPVLAIAGWLLFGPRPRITGRVVLLALIPPILWAIYTLIRGVGAEWYPYPFIDVIENGYGRVFGNILAVSVLFVGLGLLVWYLDRRLPRTDIRDQHDC